jgi:Abnormal spindle-like microcephaly-assoc'd, ASPM-SPD-2-Hydin/Protein of unknown function (DUF1573)
MIDGHAQTVSSQGCRLREIAKKLYILILIASILSFLNGCAGFVTHSKQTTSASSFQLSPSSVNFGQVAVGKQSTQSVSVSNTGSVGINITQTTFSNPQFSAAGLTMPMALAVGQTGTLTVAVNPTSAGAMAGTLTVQGDGGSAPAVINLSAMAVSSQAQISVNPTAINFGTVSNGLKVTSNLVLSNNGATSLTISMLTLTGSDYTISGLTTPTTVAPGQSAQAVVAFSPTVAGSAPGSLTITSSDPNNPTVTVALNGAGTSATTGELSTSPGSLTFGTVATGTSVNQQVVLTNTGNAAVNISAVTVVGTGLTVSGVPASTALNPSESIRLIASFAPAAAGNISGSILIASNAANSPLTIPVSATGAQAGLTISPASYNFGSVVDGQTMSQTITVTNTGTAPLTIAQLSVSGNAYSVSGLVTPLTIAAGSNTTFGVLFAPTTAGNLTGNVSIASNAPNSPNVLPLNGTGSAASAALSSNPASVSFTNVNAGSSSSKTVTITNNGNTTLTISKITVNAKDFTVGGLTAPITLAAGQNVGMNVAFNPTASEDVTGNITVTSTEGASSVVAVSGIGVQPQLTITPASASFGDATVGSSSTQTVQLSNTGTGTLTITQVSVAGTGFSTSTLSLPLILNAGQSASFNVQFDPPSAATDSGSVTVVSNAPNSSAAIALSGTGVAASQALSFSTSSLSFGNVSTGTSSTQSITVKNSGNASVTISQIAESGAGFTLSGSGAPLTLAVGQSMTFSVIFSPTTAGSDTGTVTVTSTAPGSPKTITLSGTGAQASQSVTLNWAASISTVSGYNIYRSTTSGSGYTRINSGLIAGLTYQDTTVQSGTTYYYVSTSVDSSGDESADSNQATAVIP